MGKNHRKETSNRMTLPFGGQEKRLAEIAKTQEGRIFLTQLVCGQGNQFGIPIERIKTDAFLSALNNAGWSRQTIQELANKGEIPIDPGVFQ